MIKKLFWISTAIVLSMVMLSCNDEKNPPVVTVKVDVGFNEAEFAYKGAAMAKDTHKSMVKLSSPKEAVTVGNSTIELIQLELTTPVSFSGEDKVFGGKYGSSAAASEPYQLLTSNNSFVKLNGQEAPVYFNSGEVTISVNSGKIGITGTLIGANNYEYTIEYEGDAKFEDDGVMYLTYGMSQFYSYLAKDTYHMNIFLSDTELDPGNGEMLEDGEGFLIVVSTPYPAASPLVYPGNYEVSSTMAVNKTLGRVTDDGIQQYSMHYLIDEETGSMTANNVVSGYTKIEHANGYYTVSGTYEIEIPNDQPPFPMMPLNNTPPPGPGGDIEKYEISFSYTGTLDRTEYSRPFTTLTGDYDTKTFTHAHYTPVMEFPDGFEWGHLYIYTAGWAGDFNLVTEEDEMIEFEIMRGKVDGQLSFVGNYIESSMLDYGSYIYRVGDLILMGEHGYKQGSWLTRFGQDLEDKGRVPFLGTKKFNIAQNGNVYTIEFEFLDDAYKQNTITGSYVGEIEMREAEPPF